MGNFCFEGKKEDLRNLPLTQSGFQTLTGLIDTKGYYSVNREASSSIICNLNPIAIACSH